MRLIGLLQLIFWIALTLIQPLMAQEKATKKLILWHAYRGEEKELLEEIVQALSIQFQIELAALSLPYQAFSNKLQVAIPRGNGPDLLIFAHDRLGDWIENALIEPIGYWAKEEDWSDFFPTAMEAMSYQGNLYGIPLSCKPLVLYYHRGLIKEAPKTMEELISLAQQHQALDQKPKLWGLGIPEIDSLYFHAPWFHAFSGNTAQMLALVNQSSTAPEVNEALFPLEQSTAWLFELSQKIMPKALTAALVTELFIKGQLLFVINGPWFKGELGDFKDWEVSTIPSVQGKEAKPFLSVEGLYLSSQSQHKELAFEVMKAFHLKAFNQKRVALGILTAHQKTIDEYGNQSQWFRTFAKQIQSSIPMNSHPKMKALWSPIKKYLSQMLDGHRENTLLILKQELFQALQPSSSQSQ